MNVGRGTAWVVGQLVLLALIVLIPRQINGFPTLPDALFEVDIIVGIVIAATGAGFGVLGAFGLGSNLTIFPRQLTNSSLVQDGIYGLVRHPMYTGVIVMALACAIARSSIMSL